MAHTIAADLNGSDPDLKIVAGTLTISSYATGGAVLTAANLAEMGLREIRYIAAQDRNGSALLVWNGNPAAGSASILAYDFAGMEVAAMTNLGAASFIAVGK